MIINSQRALYNVDLYLKFMLGVPYKLLPNTSLNEKFDILPRVSVPKGVYPTLKYWAIGTGGNSVVDNVGGLNYSEHGALDAALFQQIPFVMKRLDDDVDPSIREKYRFRRVELINNEEYACYYLKKIPGYTINDQFYKVVTKVMEDGTKQSMLYLVDMNDPAILDPVPRDRFITIDNVDATTCYTKLAKLEFNLSSEEVEELEKVMDLKKLERRNITEIAACTGIETLTDDGAEASCVQVAMFFGVNLDLALDLNKEGNIAKVIEIGGGESLLG